MGLRIDASGAARLVSAARRLLQRDLLALVALLVAAASAWAFVEIADEVVERSTASVDTRVLLLFREPHDLADPVGPPALAEAVRDITALGSVAVLGLASLAAAGYLLLLGKRRALVFLLVAVGGGAVVSVALKELFARTRPDVVPHLMEVYTESFPSGHSMLSAVVYLSIGVLVARLASTLRARLYVLGVALVLTILVGVSRLFLGVHWPSDVLAGWTVGLTWSVLCWLALRLLQGRGAVERSDAPRAPEHAAA